jgi:hypothetical protein
VTAIAAEKNYVTRFSGLRISLLATALLLGVAALPAHAGASVAWQKFLKADGGGRINDIVGPDSKSRLTTSSGIHLWHVGRNHKQVQFIKPHNGGRLGYLPSNPVFEHYIAQVPFAHCAGFKTGDIYGFTGPKPRLVQVTPKGKVKHGISLPSNLEPSGIVFDNPGGAFGGRLLVTERDRSTGTTGLLGFGCGGTRWYASGLPRIEGGITIAPPGFGPWAGWVLGTNESHSQIYAISAGGSLDTVMVPGGAPIGGDRGIETLGAVPWGLDGASAAFISDRKTPGNIQPGNGLMLSLGWPVLQSQGVQAGDVLAVSEGGAYTFDVRCNPVCSSSLVAYGQPNAHVEGHIAFAHRLAKVH